MSTNTNQNSAQSVEETKTQTKPNENIGDSDTKDETKSANLEFGLSKPRRRKIRGFLLNDQGGQSTSK